MKHAALIALLVLAGTAQAESSVAKKELVARLLVLQQSAIEQVAQSLIERPALQLLQRADIALQTRIPPEKRDALGKQIQEDLKKYVDEVSPQVRQQAVKLAPSTIGVLLEEKFTEDELKQLIGILESPVNRKYQQMGGEFQKVLGEKLVAQMKTVVEPKVKALEQTVVKHLGLPPPAAKASASVAKSSKN